MRELPTLVEASRALSSGETTSIQLTEQALENIERHDARLHAFITITADRARKAAQDADTERRMGRSRGMLHGIPYALKDIYDVAGVRTTAHSRILLDNIAISDSGVTERLEGAGMVLLGKLATHEFARGGPTDELPFPNARNPWNTAHFAGGSSSGSGVAVGAGYVALAMGTDTAGSVRTPAACNGVVGLKPTYGRISRRGIIPLSYSLDHAGPLTRTVEDCALAMQVLAGHDPADPGSGQAVVPDYRRLLNAGVKGMRIGYGRAYNQDSHVSDEVMEALEVAIDILRRLGALVELIELPSRRRFDAVSRTLSLSEGFAIHQKDIRERPEQYGRVTRERMMVGAFVTGAHYAQAQRMRRILAAEVTAVLAGYDAVLIAGAPTPPLRIDQIDEGPFRKVHPIGGSFNLSGHPALVVPCGFSSMGLPLSLQLVARHWDEEALFRIGHAYQAATDWHLRRPSLWGV